MKTFIIWLTALNTSVDQTLDKMSTIGKKNELFLGWYQELTNNIMENTHRQFPENKLLWICIYCALNILINSLRSVLNDQAVYGKNHSLWLWFLEHLWKVLFVRIYSLFPPFKYTNSILAILLFYLDLLPWLPLGLRNAALLHSQVFLHSFS